MESTFGIGVARKDVCSPPRELVGTSSRDLAEFAKRQCHHTIPDSVTNLEDDLCNKGQVNGFGWCRD